MTKFKVTHLYPSASLCRAAFLLSLILLIGISSLSCRKSPVDSDVVTIDPGVISSEAAFNYVSAFVGIGPKVAGSKGAQAASEYLAAKLKDVGLAVQVDEFAEGGITYRNVLGSIDGGDRGLIVLASHYDTKSGISDDFAGANDSGSSTGLLLHLAEVISKYDKLPCDMLFAFLDGEECRESYSSTDGLHGSRHLASKLVDASAKVLGVVVVDMIGDRELTVTIPRSSSPELIRLVFDAAREEGVRSKFSLAKHDILDDHVPFLQKGFPAVDIIDFHYGSSEGSNDYWHTEEDTIDKISAESLGIVGRVVVRVVNKLLQI